MFLDIAVSFIAIAVLVVAGISYAVRAKILYNKAHPPEISAYEEYRRRYIATGEESDLKLMLEQVGGTD